MTLLEVINFYVCSKLGIELDDVTGMPYTVISEGTLGTVWHHIDYGRKVDAIKALREATRSKSVARITEPLDHNHSGDVAVSNNLFVRFLNDSGLVLEQKRVLGLKEAKDLVDFLCHNTHLRG